MAAATKFLLDAHVSPVVADLLNARGIEARAIVATPLAAESDEAVLASAEAGGWTVVTANVKHFAPLLADALRSGGDPPGVVFVPQELLGRGTPGALADGLAELAARVGRDEIVLTGGYHLRRRRRR